MEDHWRAMAARTLLECARLLSIMKRFWIGLLILSVLTYAEASFNWTEPVRLVFAEVLVVGTDTEVKFSKIRSILLETDEKRLMRLPSEKWVQVETVKARGVVTGDVIPALPLGLDKLLIELASNGIFYPYGVDMPIKNEKKRAGFGRTLITAVFKDEVYIYAALKLKKEEQSKTIFNQIAQDIFRDGEIVERSDCPGFDQDQNSSSSLTPLQKELELCEAFYGKVSLHGRVIKGRFYVLKSLGEERFGHILLTSATSERADLYERDHQRFLSSLTPIYPEVKGSMDSEKFSSSAKVDATPSPSPTAVSPPTDKSVDNEQSEPLPPLTDESVDNGQNESLPPPVPFEVPVSEASPDDLRNRRRQLEIDFTFFTGLVDELFYNRYPHLKGQKLGSEAQQFVDSWNSIANELMDKLENLSPETRRKMGSYSSNDYNRWLVELGEGGASSSPTLDWIANERFYKLFPFYRGSILEPKTLGQVWFAIAEESVDEAKRAKL